MQFEATVEETPRVYRQAVVRFWVRFCGRDFTLGLIAAVACAILWAGLEYRHWAVAAVGGIAFFFVFGTLSVLMMYLARARREVREIDDNSVEWTFSDDGICRRSESGDMAVSWASVDKLWRFPDVWLVFMGEPSYSMLPRESLTPLMEGFIANMVQRHGGRVS